jgi:AraC-like DNA-binding protein
LRKTREALEQERKANEKAWAEDEHDWLLAGDKPTNFTDPISIIARSLGYESESAFSTAFKRIMGCSPRQYRRDRNPTAPFPGNAQAARANQLEPVAG